MGDRVHVTIALDLFVEDGGAMRQAAFDRLRSAWSGEEDFPYESETDVPFDQVVHSVLADALAAELPGCRRSELEVEVKAPAGEGSQRSSRDGSDAAAPQEGERDDDDSDAEPRPTTGATDSSDSSSEEDVPPAEASSSDSSSNSGDVADESHDDERGRDSA